MSESKQIIDFMRQNLCAIIIFINHPFDKNTFISTKQCNKIIYNLKHK